MKSYAPSEKSGGGTELKETVLWTNSNPSASFSEQSVTLSDSISNYDYIKVEWVESTTAQTNKSEMLIVADEFSKYKNPNQNQHVVGVGIYARKTTRIYVRLVCHVTDSSVWFSSSYGVNDASSDHAAAIPLHIYGVK